MSAGRFTTANIPTDYNEKLKQIASMTGDTVSGILARITGEFIADYEAKNGEKMAKLAELNKQREALLAEIRSGK